MHAEPLAPDAHSVWRKGDVLQAGIILRGEREVAGYQSRLLPRPGNLIVLEVAQADKAGVVHDPCELLSSLDESLHGIPVADFLRDDEATAQRAEVALPAAAFLCGLRQEQPAPVIEKRPLVEVPLETPAEKTHVLLLEFRTVVLPDKPVLLVDDTEVRKHPDGLAPCPVHGLIFRRSYGVDFRQCHLEGHGDVRIL